MQFVMFQEEFGMEKTKSGLFQTKKESQNILLENLHAINLFNIDFIEENEENLQKKS